MFTVRKAEIEDIDPIKGLLRNAGLNEQGVDEHIPHFLVIENPKKEYRRMVGSAGMEVYGKRALLRSFVMENASWNAKAAMELISTVLTFTHHRGLQEVYLLAGISGNIFEHFGFRTIAWEELPEEIRQSDHVQQSEREGGQPMVYQP